MPRQFEEALPGEVEKKIVLALQNKGLREFKYNSTWQIFGEEFKEVDIRDALRNLGIYGITKFVPHGRKSYYLINQEELDAFCTKYCPGSSDSSSEELGPEEFTDVL